MLSVADFGNVYFVFFQKCNHLSIFRKIVYLDYARRSYKNQQTVFNFRLLHLRLDCGWIQGRIQDFKLGGGGGALKKIAPSGGRREKFWGISCEKTRFYAKKSYSFQLRREARKILGYFVWKITILRQKIKFFVQFEGGWGRAGCAPPPGSAPGYSVLESKPLAFL